ncbi:hypothetical protein [Streptomyces sp. NBC_01276]|uniref:hypothetical protein n=1 Tax=Streptomyces sp. NBC_01276 TaxID=2903808 RepID=UPI00352D3860
MAGQERHALRDDRRDLRGAEDGRGLLLVQLPAAEAGGELGVTVDEFGKAVRVSVPAA